MSFTTGSMIQELAIESNLADVTEIVRKPVVLNNFIISVPFLNVHIKTNLAILASYCQVVNELLADEEVQKCTTDNPYIMIIPNQVGWSNTSLLCFFAWMERIKFEDIKCFTTSLVPQILLIQEFFNCDGIIKPLISTIKNSSQPVELPTYLETALLLARMTDEIRAQKMFNTLLDLQCTRGRAISLDVCGDSNHTIQSSFINRPTPEMLSSYMMQTSFVKKALEVEEDEREMYLRHALCHGINVDMFKHNSSRKRKAIEFDSITSEELENSHIVIENVSCCDKKCFKPCFMRKINHVSGDWYCFQFEKCKQTIYFCDNNSEDPENYWIGDCQVESEASFVDCVKIDQHLTWSNQTIFVIKSCKLADM